MPVRNLAAAALALAVALLAPAACRFPAPADPAIRRQIDAVVLPALREGRHVGLVVGIVRDGRGEVHGYGRISHSDPRPPDADTLFEIGSITKTLTAALLADMAARGEVGLDDPVQSHLPDHAIPRRNGHAVTLAHLASHASGLPRLPHDLFTGADPANPYAHFDLDRLRDSIAGEELRRDPGDRYLYSNLGAGLLGQALARRAGTPYAELLRARVLDPLGLRDTAVMLSDAQRRRLAPGHSADGKPVPNWDLNALAPAGALRSSGADMVAYLEANLAGDVAMLEAGHEPRISRGKLEVGLGWHRSPLAETSARMTWHNGGTGGYRSFLGFVKDRSVGVVVLGNSAESVDRIGVGLLKLFTQTSTASTVAR